MKTISSLTAAVALLAFSGLATAQAAPTAEMEASPEPRAQQLSQQLHANQDGTLDASEAAADKGVNNAFPRLAKDSKVDAERFARWYKAYDAPPAQD